MGKVERKLHSSGSISSSVWGLSLWHLRHLYIAKFRPIVAYGCAVWFQRGLLARWNLSTALIKQLKTLERRVLIRVAGAYKQTATHYLYKELHIQPIVTYLECQALTLRARTRPHNLDNRMMELRPCPAEVRAIKNAPIHPYDMQDNQALRIQRQAKERLLKGNTNCKPHERKNWDNRKHRGKAISACVRELGESTASKSWKAWKVVRQVEGPHDQPVLWDNWGRHNLLRYKGLTRAQSSMLLICRTGFGGLRTHLFNCKVC